MSTAPDLWDAITNTHAPLPSVRYNFRLHGWAGAPWHVRRFELVEALNAPYQLTLELIVDEPQIDLDDLLGDTCTLDLERGLSLRTIYGVVLAADDLGRAAGRHQIRLTIGPALALLAQRVDTRAWQDCSAVEILREVLAGPLDELGRSVRLGGLRTSDYPRRDYCVQFRESDLDFAARLMEEEGIAYFFDHTGNYEALVLVDDNRDFTALSTDRPIDIIVTEPEMAPAESVQRFVWGRRLRSTAVTQRNFDWQAPQAPITAAHPGADLRGRSREVYEHDDIVYPGDGERHARLKHERLAIGGHHAAGSSNITGLAPGTWFELHGHARAELDDRYLVTRIVHRGDLPDAAILAVSGEGPRYINEFECIPLEVPFRPPRLHRKPRVSGLQTAIVTGPAGEEVHCDEHGRIKVLPHWDRLSPADETSSWWVRVAHAVAGSGWGCFFLPRIGMEVILDFLDGDPDRPLVVGCVYNGQNGPPYSLPADKTKTTIKSNTSPGGNGSNELRFEDQAGAEEVYLHAQKDWNTTVENNRSLNIGANETNSVGANRTRTVGMNETVTVGMNETVTVGMNQTLTVGMNITQTCGANLTRTVGANETVNIKLNQDETIGVDQSLTVKGSRTKSVSGSEAASVGGGRNHSVAQSETISVGGAQAVSVGGQQVISVGEDQATTVKKNHALTVALASAETIGLGKVLTIGAGYQESVGLVLNTTVGVAHLEQAGTTRKILAGQSIELICGGSRLILDASGKVSLTGTNIELTASGPVRINGAVIDLN